MATYLFKGRILEERRRLYKRKLFCYRLGIIFKLFALIGAVVSVFAFFNRVFSVKEILVESDIPFYSLEEIIEAGDVKKGSNIFFCNKNEIKKNIEKKLPFASAESVKKKMPDKILINVKGLERFLCFKTASGYVLTDRLLKVLEVVPELKSRLPVINGVELVNVKLGEMLCFKDEEKSNVLSNLIDAIGGGLLNSIGSVNIEDVKDIKVVYENRILIKFGCIEGIEPKVTITKHILKEKIRGDEKGELDLSLYLDEGKVHFLPEEEKLVQEESISNCGMQLKS